MKVINIMIERRVILLPQELHLIQVYGIHQEHALLPLLRGKWFLDELDQ